MKHTSTHTYGIIVKMVKTDLDYLNMWNYYNISLIRILWGLQFFPYSICMKNKSAIKQTTVYFSKGIKIETIYINEWYNDSRSNSKIH